MAVAEWRAVLTDPNYVPQGELFNASERTLSTALNRADTAGFKIRTDNPFADLVMSLECYLKLYRNDVLVFFGPLLNAQESVDEQGAYITANAAGPTWAFAKRYPQKGQAPLSYTGTRANIVTQLITVLASQYISISPAPSTSMEKKAHGELGIGWTGTVNAGSTITYGVQPFKPMSDILSDLSNTTSGFDWRVIARENWVGGVLSGEAIGNFTAASTIGTLRTEAIFEFGDGRLNIKGYNRTRSRDTQANNVTHLLGGQPEFAPANYYELGNANIAAGVVGVLEDVVQADITDPAQRTALVTEHVIVRREPREIIVFSPSMDYGDGRMPRYGIDYDVGDIVIGRALSNDSVRFNGLFRVWGVNFSIDSNGVETPALTVEAQ